MSMPLSMVKEGEINTICKVVTVVSQINGNIIVNVKGSRVAIGRDMANKVMVM